MSKELSPELKAQIEQEALRFTKDEGYQKVFIAGATEYAPYKVRCEKAIDHINELRSTGVIEFRNEIINEIKSFLDGSK